MLNWRTQQNEVNLIVAIYDLSHSLLFIIIFSFNPLQFYRLDAILDIAREFAFIFKLLLLLLQTTSIFILITSLSLDILRRGSLFDDR